MRRFRDPFVLFFQGVLIALSLSLAFWVRFDFSIPSMEWEVLSAALTIVVPVKLLVFFLGRLHRDSWRHAGLQDLARIGFVNIGAAIFTFGTVSVWVGPAFPRSVFAIDLLICFLAIAGVRFTFRLYYEALKPEPPTGKGVLIYGTGSAGRTLLREIRSEPSLGIQVLGFIDDDPSMKAMRIMDVPVLGGCRDISKVVERYRNRTIKVEEVIVANASASGKQMREAHANCRGAGVLCRTIPSIGDILSGQYLSSQLRNISLEDLLGREQIRLDEDRIERSIEGKSVLITGAAGSIGSELCRQTATFSPARLVILDQAESDLFRIDQELRQKHPDLEIVPVIADIRHIPAISEVVRRYSIESIYHAAAYKHVPMMERHILEAVRNNVLGTRNLVEIARQHRVSSFVMISSDKAVRPTSIMGTTKRIAELIVSAASSGKDNVTKFVSVRFGNVLESNGSVVPTFRAQIAAGGPVTVTHPEMRRYFMSIREAVQLVLQASTMGKGSNIFVLDMGEPVRILDLATNMIQLAGLVPNDDVEIRITGLRPGEKLFEEIALEGEDVLPTHHEKIRIFNGKGIGPEIIAPWITQLQLLVEQRDEKKVLNHLTELVPEYNVPELPKLSRPEVVRVTPSNGLERAAAEPVARPAS
jgi:FlaA1/EpsC-like NDP-sugar epimerase